MVCWKIWQVFNKMNLKNLGILNRMFGKRIVHIEAIHLTYEKLVKHLKKYKSKCYCITPSNYNLTKGYFGIEFSKKEYYNKLKRKYLDLKEMGVNLQLHVHLAIFPQELGYKIKKELIEDAYNFFISELNIIPKEIVLGWYASDKDSKEIAKNLGLKIIPEHFHIYDWWLK